MRRFRLDLIRIALGCICLLLCMDADSHGSGLADGKAVAIVSDKYRQYVEALDALEETMMTELSMPIEVVYMDSDLKQSPDVLANRFSGRDDISVFIAMGRRATRFLWNNLADHEAKKIYTMVLNPETVVPDMGDACGVSFNLPAGEQVKIIRQAFSSYRRIGLICNPDYNAAMLQAAVAAGRASDIEIVPIEVKDPKEIKAALQKNWSTIDALWMIPDQTVTLEKRLVAYIIKEALKNGVPVIGFNSYFYKKGAALCWLSDYGDIGFQTGRLVVDVLRGADCTNNPPDYKVWYNIKVLEAFGFPYDKDAFNGDRIGPGP